MIGCLSRLALRDAFASGRLVELRVDELDLKRSLYTVTHRERHMSAAITAFIAVCEEAQGYLPGG
jgi:DNA-binding transcriptional LysR family regulator